MQQDLINEQYPFADIYYPNLLIFSNLDVGNISLRLVRHIGKAHSIGPILIGLAKPIHLLPKGTVVKNIVNLAVIACVDSEKVGEKEIEKLKNENSLFSFFSPKINFHLNIFS